MAVRREYVADLYKNLLGREGSEGEIEGHLNNPGGEQALYQLFAGSPEYASKSPYGSANQTWEDQGGKVVTLPKTGESHGYQVQGGVDPTSVGMTPSPVYDPATGLANNRPSTTTTPTTPQRVPYTNFTSRGNDYSAFNTGREQDPAKSAKDAYAMLTNSAPPPPFSDRAAYRAWRNQHVVPGMNALGHKVISEDENGFTYTNHEGTFYVDDAQNLGAASGTMLQRLQWNATPADDATRARYAGSGGSGGSGGGGGAAGGSGSGSNSTVGNLRDIYTTLGQQYGGPGGPGITTGPLQQVGQDPLSLLLTGALANFVGSEGKTGFGNTVQDALGGVIERGGELPNDQIARRFESARELLDKGRRTMINDLEGDLVSRNLMSEPGIPQGAHIGGLERITENIAPEFSRALRDIYTDESAKADTRMMSALQMATGFSTDQARNLLAGIGEGTARQSALADLALRELQTNMAWNQFLAQFGLERDKVMYEIQNGGIQSIMPLLQAFMQLGGMSNAGYV